MKSALFVLLLFVPSLVSAQYSGRPNDWGGGGLETIVVLIMFFVVLKWLWEQTKDLAKAKGLIKEKPDPRTQHYCIWAYENGQRIGYMMQVFGPLEEAESFVHRLFESEGFCASQAQVDYQGGETTGTPDKVIVKLEKPVGSPDNPEWVLEDVRTWTR